MDRKENKRQEEKSAVRHLIAQWVSFLLVFAFFSATAMGLAEPEAEKTRADTIELTQEIKTPDGFTIRLPAGWVSIPRDVLDSYANKIARNAPNLANQRLDYGFQLSTSRNWFEYPYIMVQIKRTGRIPESQLESLDQVQRGMNKGLGQTQQSMSGVISDAHLGKTTYDPSLHILWSRISANVTGIGVVKGLCAVLLTEDGVIQIISYAMDRDFERSAPLFEEIAKNAVVDDNLRYKPRLTDKVPVAGSGNGSAAYNMGYDIGRGFGTALFWGLVLIVFFKIASWIFKRVR